MTLIRVIMRLDFAFFTAIQPFISVHQEKNHTVCRHSGGAIFLFICIKKNTPPESRQTVRFIRLMPLMNGCIAEIKAKSSLIMTLIKVISSPNHANYPN